jgi:uncharacterized repeat protein (TIGR04052 family)
MRSTNVLVCTAALALALSACGDGDDVVDAGTEDAGEAALDAGDQRDAGDAQDDAALDAGDGMRSVSIRFKAKLGSEDLACGRNYPGQGSTGVTATPQDFRFFVQEVRLLHKEDGREEKVVFDLKPPFQSAQVALLDFTDGSGSCAGSGSSVLNTTLTGKVPAGAYDGIVFVNGVPEELNHAGPAETAEAPLDDVSLFWSWLSGYRFIIAELLPVGAHDGGVADGGAHGDAGNVHGGDAGQDAGTQHGADAAVAADGGAHGSDGGAHGSDGGAPGSGHGASQAAFVHVGSSACTGSQSTVISCARKARNEIRLSGFDPSKNVVIADLSEVFKQSDLKSPLACHGVAAVCAPPYGALGINMDTGEKGDAQSVFRVE